jgi:hypothetical protein
MDNNAYLLTCTVTGTAVLIDAASEAGRLIELIGSTPVTRIVTTHRRPHPGKSRGPAGGHMRMHARLSGKRQARDAPGTGTGTPSSGFPHRSLAPIPVRHASVDTATQRPTALQGDTCWDREETPR